MLTITSYCEPTMCVMSGWISLDIWLAQINLFFTFIYEYAKWHDPSRNRRQSFLEESYLGVFTQLNDYRILNAGCCGAWSSLPAVFLSCIYNFKIGIKTQKLFEMT